MASNPLPWKDIGAYRTTSLDPFPLPKDLFWEKLTRKKLAEFIPKQLQIKKGIEQSNQSEDPSNTTNKQEAS